jgi:hypothetical protein
MPDLKQIVKLHKSHFDEVVKNDGATINETEVPLSEEYMYLVPDTETEQIRADVDGLIETTDAQSEDIAKNAEDISMLKQAAFQSGVLMVTETEETYTERTTAEGANVLDGSKSILKKVEGGTAKSENLFMVDSDSKVFTNTQWGITFDAETQIFIVPVGAAAFSNSLYKLPVPIPAGTTVTCTLFIESGQLASGSAIEVGGYCNLDGSKSWQGSTPFTTKTDLAGTVKSKTFTTTAPVTDFWFFYNNGSTVEKELKFRVMFTIGDTAPTEFKRSFTGLKNSKFQGLTSIGKNVFSLDKFMESCTSTSIIRDGDELLVITQSYQENYTKHLFPATLSGGATISFDCESVQVQAGNPTFGCVLIHDDGTTTQRNIGIGAVGTKQHYTLSSSKNVIGMQIGHWQHTGRAKLTNIQVEHGTTETEYQPYHEETLALPEGVENGLGTTIDFENQKIVESGADIILTGDESISYYWYSHPSLTAEHGNGVNINLASVVDTSRTWSIKISTDSSEFKGYLPSRVAMLKSGNGMYWLGILDHAQLTSSNEQVTDATEQSTLVTNFKAWLKERYDNGNPVMLRIGYDTPIETPFTDAQKAVGNKVTAYSGGTEIVEGNDNAEWVENTLYQEYFEVGKV